jgi:hypothetical protein
MTDFKIINFGYKTIPTVDIKKVYKDNLHIMSKIKRKIFVEEDTEAIILKKKYLEQEKQKRENQQEIIPVSKTYKKNQSNVKKTIKHIKSFK